MALSFDEIPALERPTEKALRERCLRTRRPGLVRGAMADWPARGKWSIDYFREELGDLPGLVYRFAGHRPRLDGDSRVSLHEMTFRTFADRMAERQEDGYFFRFPGLRHEDRLWTDVRLPPGARTLRLKSNLLISARDMVVGLHYDLPRNFLTQVSGRKEVLLIAPADSRRIDPYPWYSSLRHVARVRLDEPDLETHPDLDACPVLRCVLEPGDMVYIPPGWWHHTRSLTPSISVNFWWATPTTYPLVCAIDLFKKISRYRVSFPPRRAARYSSGRG